MSADRIGSEDFACGAAAGFAACLALVSFYEGNWPWGVIGLAVAAYCGFLHAKDKAARRG